ncbi:putative amidohydrolase [Mycolicibacterium iranicum]|uniref:Putative amidohydrolase n=1 Tax=Mycolicibacterium iranicum TaxID=912594 RepID=A0A839Q875_MYCIR|nr:nitrilase-related carbon-nitrogen hydrolase [Mycolicibacterium iranicum]MBB2990615.1 putative amidohydrolase [Mycolicibacterium iranicum]
MTRIACCQLDPVLGDLDGNSEVIAVALDDAVRAGADVVVLPELATSGYMFTDADEARIAALTPSDPRFTTWSSGLGGALAVVGFCELGDDGLLYNSAAVMDSTGVVAIYRKTHLWDRERLVFTPGSTLPPVLQTRHGAVAVMVCYDLEFGELTRRVAVDGADLIVASVNWPLFPRPEGERPGEVITAMSTARLNRVAVAACDRAGVERGQAWTAGSAIVNQDGWVVAEAGPGTGMALADIDLTLSRSKKITEHVDLLADRRLDLY